jgi:hypothetical protein
MTAICHDQRRPSPVGDPHGPWWFTLWLPIGFGRALYIAAATGRRFFWDAGRDRISVPLLCVAWPRYTRRGVLLRRPHRWCAHMNVSYEEDR